MRIRLCTLRNLPIRQKVSAIIMLTTSCTLVAACAGFIIYDYVSLRRNTLNDLRALASVVAAKSDAAHRATVATSSSPSRSSTAMSTYDRRRVAAIGVGALVAIVALLLALLMTSALQEYQSDLERQVTARTQDLSIAVERNQAILDSAGEGIFGLDLSGIVTFINPSAARILGADAFSIIGQSLHSTIHCSTCPDRPLPYHQCKVCGATLHPAVRSGRGKFAGMDNNLVPIEYTSSTMIDGAGNATGVVVTFRDISERLAVEKMKDEFVSTVSHELRTPLTAIRGAIGLLGAGLLGNPTPQGQRMLDIALSNTDRLGRLINDILDLEKMESGRVELHRQSSQITGLLEQAVDAMQPMADRAGIKVFVNAAQAELVADPDRILQMLINLISNAIKFSPAGTNIDVTGRVAEDMYVVSVRDEGRGIPEEMLETVFDRFKQVDASDSRDKGGTGLGLAICRSIAEAHGGKIWARRADPAGSVFTFTLPMPAVAGSRFKTTSADPATSFPFPRPVAPAPMPSPRASRAALRRSGR